MLTHEIWGIVDKECAAGFNPDLQARIREKLCVAVGEEIVKTGLSEDLWLKFLDAAEAERDLAYFVVLSSLGDNCKLIKVGEEKIMSFGYLCGRTRSFCEFLMDNYEIAPEDIKKEWDLDGLMSLAAETGVESEKFFRRPKGRKGFLFEKVFLGKINKLISSLRLVILGEDLNSKFNKEMNSVEMAASQYFEKVGARDYQI
ncbi:MAG: hypothetical protein KGJ89_03440 [Patescibacteria group bacterium]|nr:hypothetical protein [Patescibacteria group bacterium]MDE2015400.1 hypothetical protein [Patescibacteria group bacterium]MDE2226985.1 hypothetical protein [Patescibacteria group bacterium]